MLTKGGGKGQKAAKAKARKASDKTSRPASTKEPKKAKVEGSGIACDPTPEDRSSGAGAPPPGPEETKAVEATSKASGSACGPSPDRQLEKSSRTRKRTKAKLIQDKEVLCLDLRGVLDCGARDRYIPRASIDACKLALTKSFILYVCTWVGHRGEDVEQERRLANRKRLWLSGRLGLERRPAPQITDLRCDIGEEFCAYAEVPKEGHIGLTIARNLTWTRKSSEEDPLRIQTKAVCLASRGIRVIIDTREAVLSECSLYGIVGYQVRGDHRGQSAYLCPKIFRERGLSHEPSWTLEQAVKKVIRDKVSGNLEIKARLLEGTKEFGPP